MNYVFGPVNSRRLGKSLGIDTIPLKTCNWNCVYCQLGRTGPLSNLRQDYFPPADILAEVKDVIQAHQPGRIDWVTFVGSGEPTLHASIGWLIRQVKDVANLPLAVITNGALLYLPEVREDLLAADAVMPSLDAGSPEVYRKINRPHPETTFERLLNGLIAFRAQYPGKLWVEVMLIQGLNDTEQALWDIARALEKVKPEAVHINLPTRPPAETWVQPPGQESIMRAQAILSSSAEVVHPAEGNFDLSGCDNLVEAVIGIILRHPLPQEELLRALMRWSAGLVEQTLVELEAAGRVQVVERYGVQFWSAASAQYPDDAHSLRTKPGARQAVK